VFLFVLEASMKRLIAILALILIPAGACWGDSGFGGVTLNGSGS
jgi:hypothetical protein